MLFLILIGPVIVVAVIVAVVMSFFVRRHGEAVTPAEDWQATSEVSIDPTTNRLMRVWVDPHDGSRHYVADR